MSFPKREYVDGVIDKDGNLTLTPKITTMNFKAVTVKVTALELDSDGSEPEIERVAKRLANKMTQSILTKFM